MELFVLQNTELQLKMNIGPCLLMRSQASFVHLSSSPRKRKIMQQILFSPVSPSTAQKLTEGRKCINKSQSLPKGNRKYIIDSKYLTLEWYTAITYSEFYWWEKEEEKNALRRGRSLLMAQSVEVTKARGLPRLLHECPQLELFPGQEADVL